MVAQPFRDIGKSRPQGEGTFNQFLDTPTAGTGSGIAPPL